LKCVHKREPPSDLFTCMVLDKKTWRCLNDASIIFIRFSSNSVMVTSVWPPTRKKAMSVSAFASFSHYKIIPTQVYEMKTKHTWQSSRMSVVEVHKSDVIYNLYVIMISSVFSHSQKLRKTFHVMFGYLLMLVVCNLEWLGFAFARLRIPR
jgi:hypothetical protein